MTQAWPDEVDEVLGGDQVVGFAQITPARGIVITPLTNFALRDRSAGTLAAVNSSVGMWRKLERVRRNPRVALAYHTREHSSTDRPEFVLVQGTAELSEPQPDYFHSTPEIRDAFERAAGGYPRGGRLTQWWLRDYHLRIEVRVRVHRIVVWPDLECQGDPAVYGEPLPPDSPDPQKTPKKGTGPRLNARRAARRAARLPHALLGWVGADRFPTVVPVSPTGGGDEGMTLRAPAGTVPPGGRRAGLTAHEFSRYVVGQTQQIHTGWLEGGDEPLYAPHTEWSYRFPRSNLAYKIAGGFGTRRGVRQGRRAGVISVTSAGDVSRRPAA